jgi:hypothetical protein
MPDRLRPAGQFPAVGAVLGPRGRERPLRKSTKRRCATSLAVWGLLTPMTARNHSTRVSSPRTKPRCCPIRSGCTLAGYGQWAARQPVTAMRANGRGRLGPCRFRPTSIGRARGVSRPSRVGLPRAPVQRRRLHLAAQVLRREARPANSRSPATPSSAFSRLRATVSFWALCSCSGTHCHRTLESKASRSSKSSSGRAGWL